MSTDDMHLNRAVICEGCAWAGINGELIAKDKLRCPRCDGDQIHYVGVVDAPPGVQ